MRVRIRRLFAAILRAVPPPGRAGRAVPIDRFTLFSLLQVELSETMAYPFIEFLENFGRSRQSEVVFPTRQITS